MMRSIASMRTLIGPAGDGISPKSPSSAAIVLVTPITPNFEAL